jgi:hypothetical protein
MPAHRSCRPDALNADSSREADSLPHAAWASLTPKQQKMMRFHVAGLCSRRAFVAVRELVILRLSARDTSPVLVTKVRRWGTRRMSI